MHRKRAMSNFKKTKNALNNKVDSKKNKTSLEDEVADTFEAETRNRIKNASFYGYAEHLYNTKKLTIKQLRSYKGLSKISDQLAQEIIDGLYKLSIITYKIHTQNGT